MNDKNKKMKKLFKILLILALISQSTVANNFFRTELAHGATKTLMVDLSGDPTFGSRDCDGTAGTPTCSLREAVEQAVIDETEDVMIIFDSNITSITLSDISGPDLLTLSNDNHSITIDGENRVTITYGSGQYDSLFQIGTPSINSTNNVIKNLVIDGFKNGIVIYGDNNTVQYVTIKGGESSGECDNVGQRGIAILAQGLKSPTGNNVLNNTISCFRKGIMGQFLEQTTIAGNSIRRNASTNDTLNSPDYDDSHLCFTVGIEIQGSVSGTGAVNSITNNQVYQSGSVIPSSGSCADPGDFASGGIILDDYKLGIDAELHVSDMIVSGNHISANIGDGIGLFNARKTIVRNNNVETNGTATPTSGNVTTDQGNGIALRCTLAHELFGGADISGPQNNFIYRNNILRNADDGIFVETHCGPDGPNDVIDNTFLENSIYENGRNSGAAISDDDGIGIDLQPESGDVGAFAYTDNNQNITPNDPGDTDVGGNNVMNFPVITSANYDSVTNEWIVSGTLASGSGADALIEVFQVGCSSANLPTDIDTCDIDRGDGRDDRADNAPLGYGSGRYFLGRGLADESGNWQVIIPNTVGFSGGLITATATSTTTDSHICMTASTSDSDIQQVLLGGHRVCSTSEFSENFLAQTTTMNILFNKIVAPSTVPQGGTVSVILTVTNLSDMEINDEEINISDDLAASGLSLDAGTCTFSTSEGSSTCSQSGNNFVLAGGVRLLPADVLTIRFTATVSNTATIGSHTNTANFIYAPVTPNIDLDASDDFTVTAPGGDSTCSTPPTPDTNPDASFTIDGHTHDATYATTPYNNVPFVSVNPSAGNAPLVNKWTFDGVLDPAQTGSNASFDLTVGTHTVLHIVSDCDGDTSVDVVAITASSTTSTPSLTLNKSILPNTGLHTGDAVTVTIQAANPTTGVALNTIVLSDVLTALNPTITSCRFEKNALPGSGSATCTVAADGKITLTPSPTVNPGDTLYIQYTTTVTGAPGTYTDPVSYAASSPTITPIPSPASAQFTVVSGTSTGTCTGTTDVDAEFAINGEPTPSTTMSKAAGTYTFVNDDTSGDGTLTYLWSINGVNQTENGNSMTRTLAPGTSIIALMKSDCNGSIDSDTLTLTITGGSGVGTGGTFEVTKTVENPKTLYAVDGGSTDSIIYRISIKNSESSPRTYTLEDHIPTTFKDTANVLDLAGGTNATVPGLVKITNISLLAGETKTVRYSVTFKSANDFPLNLYSLSHDADPNDDSDFYVDDVKDENIENDNNDFTDEDNITDAPDGKFVSLGEDGSIIVDVGAKKVIVDGDSDDFGLFTIDNHALDFDRADEEVEVSVSQDGVTYKKLSGDTTFDLGDAELPWARYVKIQDDTSTSVTQSGAAGIDIDAVCLFNLGVSVTNQANVTMANAVGSASNTIYVNVTEAFDDPLKKSDCRESGTPVLAEVKEPRTVELPLPPASYTPSPTPSSYFPPSMPVLPKTGPEFSLVATGIIGLIALVVRRRKK